MGLGINGIPSRDFRLSQTAGLAGEGIRGRMVEQQGCYSTADRAGPDGLLRKR